jgi:hypothetical protein
VVLIDWALAYFTYDRSARIISRSAQSTPDRADP